MKSLKKTNNTGVAPIFRSLVDDFWGSDNFFGKDYFHLPSTWMPAVNIKDKKDKFLIEVAVPGLKKEDFDIKVENGMLHISAEREESKEEQEEDYTRKEFSYNSFERTFAIPENADDKTISAKYTDGVLKLTMKKTKVAVPKVKKIAIS